MDQQACPAWSDVPSDVAVTTMFVEASIVNVPVLSSPASAPPYVNRCSGEQPVPVGVSTIVASSPAEVVGPPPTTAQAYRTPAPSASGFGAGQMSEPGSTLPVAFADEKLKMAGSHRRWMLNVTYGASPLPMVLTGTCTLPATSDGAPTAMVAPVGASGSPGVGSGVAVAGVTTTGEG